MPIYDLFSKRQKRLRGEVPDVYCYDDIPKALRVQIIHIIKDAFGENLHGHPNPGAYKTVHDILCREYGLFTLEEYANSNFDAICSFLLNNNDCESMLDVIDLCFKLIEHYDKNPNHRGSNYNIKMNSGEAIKELNERFKEHGVGYQFESGTIIRVDSQFIHSETIKPVLQLLGNKKRFQGANEEFLKAHEHYRNGNYKECLAESLKSFESVMKAICQKQRWTYNQNDTASKLIDICFKNGLIPDYLQSQFSGLKSILESGVPTLRNKLGGHGQGTSVITVTQSIAEYALHLTASNILFLLNCEKENLG